MNKSDSDREIDMVGFVALFMGVVIGMVLMLALVTAFDNTPTCHEDEVISWDDATNAHTACWHIDDVLEWSRGEVSNTVIIYPDACTPVDAPYYACEIDPLATVGN